MTLAKVLLALAILLPATLPSAAAAEDAILVPLPNDADEGRYVLLDAEGETSNATFAISRETFTDAWAREVDGFRVSFDALGGGARCTTLVGGLQGEQVASSTTSLERYLRYGDGGARPLVHGGELRFCAGAGVNFEGETGTLGNERIDYLTWVPFACLFRNGLQGESIPAGASFEGACGAIDRGASWNVGGVVLRDGFRTVNLSFVRNDDAGTYRAEIVAAEGVAYPLELALERTDDDGTTRARYMLEALATGGEPFGDGVPLPDPGALPTHPIDPLLGPDDAGARLPLRLRDAARAAIADPTLSELPSVLVKPGAVLAGAVLYDYSPGGVAGTSPTWRLVYSAPGATAVSVSCTGTSSPVALPTDPPLARCTSDVSSGATIDLDLGAPPPDFGAEQAPIAGVSFRDALDRLEARDPSAAQRSVTFGLYRAWSEPAEREHPALGVGTLAFGPDPSGEDTSLVTTVELATGRSLLEFRDADTPIVVSAIPAGISAGGITTGPPANAPDRASNAPALIGAGVATIGILALVVFFWTAVKAFFAALFTRLVRPKVLDAELRASIHELVLSRPGVHASEIIQHFDRGTGAIEYHLDVLVREGFLTSLKTSGYRHYFVTGRFSPGEMRAIAALRAGQGERLYRIIEANPGIHVQALAEQAGLSVGYVSKEIKRMNEAGLVDQVKVGRAVRLHALDR